MYDDYVFHPDNPFSYENVMRQATEAAKGRHPASGRSEDMVLYSEGPSGAPELLPLLSCGHYGEAQGLESATWNNPGVAVMCVVCEEERQLSLRLQVSLVDGSVVWGNPLL